MSTFQDGILKNPWYSYEMVTQIQEQSRSFDMIKAFYQIERSQKPGFFKRKITVKEREREINKTEREKDVHFDTVALCLRDREIERERDSNQRER